MIKVSQDPGLDTFKFVLERVEKLIDTVIQKFMDTVLDVLTVKHGDVIRERIVNAIMGDSFTENVIDAFRKKAIDALFDKVR